MIYHKMIAANPLTPKKINKGIHTIKKIKLILLSFQDKHIVQKAFQMTDKFLRLIKAHDIIIDRSIIASLFTQLLYIICIRKIC